MNKNVIYLPRPFDAEIDDTLSLFAVAPPTKPIEFGQLLAGPAQPVEPEAPAPAPRAKHAYLWRFSVVTGAYFLGIMHASVIISVFR